MIVRELLTRLGFVVNPAGAQQYNRALSNINSNAMILQRNLGGVVGVLGSAFTIGQLARWADTWTRAGNKIRAAELASGLTARNMEQINDIANRAGAPLEAISSLYSRIMRSTEQIGGVTEEQIARVTETVSKALQAGGASGAEVSAVLVQLGQALNSGRLQGDELRSILENSAPLAQAIADEFGVAVGELKEMGSEGKLTSDRVFKGILKGSKEVDEQFAATNMTIERAMTIFTNKLIQFIGTTDSAYGVTVLLTDSILWLSNHLEIVAGAAMLLVIPALMSLVMWVGTTVAAFTMLAIGLLSLPITWVIAGLALLALAIEDIYMWVTGGKSLIGQLLGTTWQQELDMFTGSLKDGWKDITTAFDTATLNLKTAWLELTTAFAPEISFLSETIWDPLKLAFPEFVEDVKTMFSGLITWAGDKVSEWGDKIRSVGTTIRSYIPGGDIEVPSVGDAARAEADAIIEGARAGGGPVGRGKRYLVGEQGPEAFVPRSSGWILPAGLTDLLGRSMEGPRAGGGVSIGDVNVNAQITVPEGTTEEQTSRIMDGIERTIQEGIRRAVSSTLPSFPETV